MKKLLGISLLVLLASINIYGEGIEKGKGISIGKTSNSENATNIAVGENWVALGGNAQAIKDNSIAIGSGSKA